MTLGKSALAVAVALVSGLAYILLRADELRPLGCNVRTVDAADAGWPDVLQKLATSTVLEPVLIKNAINASGWEDDEQLARYGGQLLEVVHTGAGFEWAPLLSRKDIRFRLTGQAEDTRLLRLSLRAFTEALRNGSATADSYCFHDLFGTTLLTDRALIELTDLDEKLLISRHGPSAWVASTRQRAGSVLRGKLHGSAYLTFGADRSGGAFHSHTDALLGLLRGTKRWHISRRGNHPTLSRSEAEHGRARHIESKLRPAHYWQCEQRPGEAMWMPQELSHTVLNHGESLGVTMQEGVVPYHLLARAAYRGHAEGIAFLLSEAGGMQPDEDIPPVQVGRSSRADGGTALHFAAKGGSADGVRALLEGGASVDSRDMTGKTPLHVAVGSGAGRHYSREAVSGATAERAAAVEALVAAGASIDAKDGRGLTPLLYATAMSADMRIVRALLSARPSEQSVREARGLAEQALAHGEGDAQVVQLLRAMTGS